MSAPGEALRYLRKQVGIGQRDMAEAMGISPSYLSRVESGKVNASFTWMVRVLEFLGQQWPSFESGVELERIAAEILTGKYEVPEVRTLEERLAELEARVDRWEKFQPECIVKRSEPTGQKAVVITLTMVVPDDYVDDWRDDPTIERWSETLMDEGHPIFGDVYVAGGLEDFPGGAS